MPGPKNSKSKDPETSLKQEPSAVSAAPPTTNTSTKMEVDSGEGELEDASGTYKDYEPATKQEEKEPEESKETEKEQALQVAASTAQQEPVPSGPEVLQMDGEKDAEVTHVDIMAHKQLTVLLEDKDGSKVPTHPMDTNDEQEVQDVEMEQQFQHPEAPLPKGQAPIVQNVLNHSVGKSPEFEALD